jgi:hypothetical protein
MKTVNHNDEMRAEYKREVLGVGVRGKYYEAYQESHNLVLLKPEVAGVGIKKSDCLKKSDF